MIALETAGQRGAAVGTGDVITRTITLAAETGLAVVAGEEGVTGHIVDFLVTGLAPAGTQLEVVHPLGFFHKVFLVDTPAQTHGREETETVVAAETAGTVVADGHAGQVAVIVVVVGLGKEGNEGKSTRAPIGFRLSDAGIGPHIIGI